MSIPRVVVIGRMNVGKSTLFNRLIDERKAIVSPVAGTTRDRLHGIVEWDGRQFELVDTGGLDVSQAEIIEQNVVAQAERAIADSDVILFVVDARSGLLPQERELVRHLRKAKQPVILTANKADAPRLRQEIFEFQKLGLGEAVPVSATTGAGCGDLLDTICKKLKAQGAKQKPSTYNLAPRTSIKVAIVGRPNVGKSSLLNALVGSERSIVTPIAGTTREVIDELVETPEGNYLLIDTAGIRKKLLGTRSKGRIRSTGVVAIEEEAVRRSLTAVKRADVTLLVLDITEKVVVQDKRLARQIIDGGSGVIIVLNKFDLVRDKPTRDGRSLEESYEDYVTGHFPQLTFAPIALTSSADGTGVSELLPAIRRVAAARGQEISEMELKTILEKLNRRLGTPKTKVDRRNIRITSMHQSRSLPPEFLITIGPKAVLPHAIVPILEDILRATFDLAGVPIRIHIGTSLLQ